MVEEVGFEKTVLPKLDGYKRALQSHTFVAFGGHRIGPALIQDPLGCAGIIGVADGILRRGQTEVPVICSGSAFIQSNACLKTLN